MRILFFAIHMMSLLTAGAGVLIADKSALAWLRGKQEVISHRVILVAHWVVTGGLAGLILSGLMLFWPARDYLTHELVFWVKMTFVAALVINSFFIEYLMHTAARQSFASLSPRQKIPFFVSGAISTLSWLGAATAAFFILP